MDKTEQLIKDVIETVDYYNIDPYFKNLWDKDKELFLERAKKLDKEKDDDE